MIYFDNASTSRFKPTSVIRAVKKELCHSANPGRGSHDESLRAASTVESCREEIKRRFFDGNVVFTKNCTEALNLAIKGLCLKGNVVTTIYEHNSVLRTLKALSLDKHIELRIVSPEKGDIASPLLRSVTSDTSLVVITAMSNVTGETPDVSAITKAIKNKTDCLVMVDMAQAAGHIDVNLSDVDLCAFSGHKSLHGPQGTGFLLSKYEIPIRALILGGTGSSSLSLMQPDSIPDGLESGTMNTPGIAGLQKGILYTMTHFESLYQKRDKVFRSLKLGLSEIRGANIIAANNGIILVNFPGMDCGDGADRLNQYGICVRAGLHCAPLAHRYLRTLPYGAIRFSVGVDNTLSDAEITLNAIENILHNRSDFHIY
ncbi:MAG: aminotransferase class V-fold PLP-dependent enzyme [Clostridia bacterium]|nr:aminotransferase class V-fold PLP-dependent enzyme [Clostridia bacterium]